MTPLFMSSDSTDESANKPPSKRKRFKAGVKKIVSYPKRKLQKRLRKLRNDVDYTGVQDHIEIEATEQEEKSGEEEMANGQVKLNGGTNRDTPSFITHAVPESTSGEVEASLTSSAAVNSHAKERGAPEKTESSMAETIGGEGATTAVVEKTEEANGAATTTASSRSATTDAVNLSGKWELVVSEDFKTNYDNYLKLLGQPSLVRSVALSIIGLTSEETFQSDTGRELTIRGRNVRGNWERTLQASSQDDPLVVPMVTADKETVQSECWWEDNGSIHRSWLRGVEKYGGGDFESKRYLEDDGRVLVCESTFHPFDGSREKASVTWKFRRVDEPSA